MQENSVKLDADFYRGKPLPDEFAPKAIAAFMDKVNDLLFHSTQLFGALDDDLLMKIENIK